MAESPAIDPRLTRVLSKLHLKTPAELLFHYPHRHEDRSRWKNPDEAISGEAITVRGKIRQARIVYFGKRRLEMTLQLHGGFQGLRVIWYGISFLPKSFTEGTEMIVHGKIAEHSKKRVLYLAEYELMEAEGENVHLNRITPIYPTVEGLSVRAIRAAVFDLLQTDVAALPEPHSVGEGMLSLKDALHAIHFPTSWEELARARERLVFDEMLRMQIVLKLRKTALERQKKTRTGTRGGVVTAFRALLPFKLTNGQLKACEDIDIDLAKHYPMNRLLQGDVGSGKTVVAVHALLRCLERGENGAFLAPTETLAEQHWLRLKKWLEPLQIQVLLYTKSSKPDLSGNDLFQGVGTLFVGTHALLEEKVKLPRLGLGVIDEQHKFGVMQRAALQMKGDRPDILVMTATPIPRTLCLSAYGDLDVSILDEMPAGRGELRTAIRGEEALDGIWEFIRREMQSGRQTYVVYPLIDESERKDLKSLDLAYNELKKRFGADHVAMMHGRLNADQKEAVMKGFRSGEISILATTTVIEVGVDVPNATVMLIENAERFGLAQLHQLRGRVGRGAHRSYCILLERGRTEESIRRLKVMEQTLNGFDIAEEDLKIRGPGDLLGTDQSGLPPLKLGRLPEDFEMLLRARQAAGRLLASDPLLATCPGIRQEIIGMKLLDVPVSN